MSFHPLLAAGHPHLWLVALRACCLMAALGVALCSPLLPGFVLAANEGPVVAFGGASESPNSQADSKQNEKPEQATVSDPMPLEPGATWTEPMAPLRSVQPTAAKNDDPLSQNEVLRQVDRLLGELASDDYRQRVAAEGSLRELASRPEAVQAVTRRLRKVLLAEKLPLDVRSRLEPLALELPNPERIQGAGEFNQTSAEQLDRWVRLLDADIYAARVGAEAELRSALRSPQNVCLLLQVLKRRLADTELPASSRQQLEPLYHAVRREWLNSDPQKWDLPPLAAGQIEGHIQQLIDHADAEPTSAEARRFRTARRELLDLLARDDLYKQVEAAAQQRLDQAEQAGQPIPPQAEEVLLALVDWCRPAMVAEIWSLMPQPTGELTRFQTTAQYLYIGVPWKSPHNQFDDDKASHFDFCDDQRAHCVNGYTLRPGDYPVGSAFPHPERSQEMFFYLRNLPNPRRRMAFDLLLGSEYSTSGSQQRRLGVITRRTCEGFLSGKRMLTTELIPMMLVLDPAEVSFFAAQRFSRLAERPADPEVSVREVDRGLLTVLKLCGTTEVLEGISRGVDNNRLPGLTPEVGAHPAWTAALVISKRAIATQTTNSREANLLDQWLAKQIVRSEKFLSESAAEVGATAAALLVTRHGRRVEEFGLRAVQVDELQQRELAALGTTVEAYRFNDESSRRKVIGWWHGYSRQLVNRPGRFTHHVR